MALHFLHRHVVREGGRVRGREGDMEKERGRQKERKRESRRITTSRDIK
jgi:hypothetical protein